MVPGSGSLPNNRAKVKLSRIQKTIKEPRRSPPPPIKDTFSRTREAEKAEAVNTTDRTREITIQGIRIPTTRMANNTTGTTRSTGTRDHTTSPIKRTITRITSPTPGRTRGTTDPVSQCPDMGTTDTTTRTGTGEETDSSQ